MLWSSLCSGEMILMNMSLNGSPVHFKLDTGAAVTVLSEENRKY